MKIKKIQEEVKYEIHKVIKLNLNGYYFLIQIPFPKIQITYKNIFKALHLKKGLFTEALNIKMKNPKKAKFYVGFMEKKEKPYL